MSVFIPEDKIQETLKDVKSFKDKTHLNTFAQNSVKEILNNKV